MDWYDPGVFLGREAELERLRAAIRGRIGLAICGPLDSGKTALVRHAIAQLPKAAAKGCIYLPLRGAPHALLANLLGELHARGDTFLSEKFQSETGRGDESVRWAARQTSLRMRGLLYRAAQAGSYCVFLDDVTGLSDAFTGIVKELSSMRGTPVFLIARGFSEKELGRAARLYWNDDLRLQLAPLSRESAGALLEHCIHRFRLSRLNLDGFREGILRFSGRVPGAIVKMCARAADAQYHYGDRIETRLLHVDYKMRFSFHAGQTAPAQPAALPAARPSGGGNAHGARK